MDNYQDNQSSAFVKVNQAEIRARERREGWAVVAWLVVVLGITIIAFIGCERMYEQDTGNKLPAIKWGESLFQHAPRR